MYINVEVSKKECRNYECFFAHKWTTQSVNNNYTQTDDYYSCGRRNYHGCPDNPKIK